MNLHSELFSPLQDRDLYAEINNIDTLQDLSLRLFFLLFHEVLGHKKSGYSSTEENLNLSPNIFYDKTKKQIMKLVSLDSISVNKNIIKILKDPDSNSDSGSFLKYFLGQCRYGFISYLIEEMLINKVNLNFIFDRNLWNKDIEILKNYIEIKYLVFNINKNILDQKKFKDINEEIEFLKEDS